MRGLPTLPVDSIPTKACQSILLELRGASIRMVWVRVMNLQHSKLLNATLLFFRARASPAVRDT